MQEIYLKDIFTNIGNLKDYKIHFAKYNKYEEPLDVFMRDQNEWKAWNMWSNGKNDFNRKYIFSLISFYPEADTWLFGGIWEVVNTDFSKNPEYPYEISLCGLYSEFIGRLKISYSHKGRNVRNVMENYFNDFVVKEILDEVYSTHVFPGYKNIDLSFRALENIINKDNPVWKSALSLKGIYMITDIKSGKRYVGKASGENGIWQRWSDYISDGHGGDVDLHALVKKQGMDYIKNNYKFTLLEIIDTWSESDIDNRETYWKRVMLSRLKDFGHNKN